MLKYSSLLITRAVNEYLLYSQASLGVCTQPIGYTLALKYLNYISISTDCFADLQGLMLMWKEEREEKAWDWAAFSN